MIEAHALAKNFGPVTAVREVTLRASDGRITGLLGPNGAGKSTTLRILYTVLVPDAGDAYVDGISVVGAPLEARRRIGVLPHAAGIYPRLTARENILYFGALHGLTLDERRTRANELIQQLEMTDFADRPAKAAAAQRRREKFDGVSSSRSASPRISAEEIVASENAVVTPTNATRTHACAEHASDSSPLVAILHSTIATRQFFPNHLFRT